MKEFIKKLIDRLEEEKVDIGEKTGFSKGINKAIDIVNRLEEEYNNGWIPCNEKLPENFTECLVTLENGIVFEAKYIIDEFKRICEHGVTGFYENNKVIAWQPKPIPYQPKEQKGR